MISNWNGIFCFNNGRIKLRDGYSKIKKCLQNYPLRAKILSIHI